MARFATYTAPIDRIHPNDLGYTANVQLGRRLAGFASERAGTIRSDAAAQAAALRQGGALESQNILTARRADVALQRFIDEGLNPVTQAAVRNAGGGGGAGRGSAADQGGTQQRPQSRIAGPAQAAQAAAAMAQVLGGVTPKYIEQPGRYPLDPYISKGAVLKSYDVQGQALQPQEGYDSSGYNIGMSAERDRTAAPDYSYPVGAISAAVGGKAVATQPYALGGENFINLGLVNQGEKTYPDVTTPVLGTPQTPYFDAPITQSYWDQFVAMASGAASSVANFFGGTEGDTNQILSDRGE